MGCTAADLLLAPQLHLSSLPEQEQLLAQALSMKSQLQVSARHPRAQKGCFASISKWRQQVLRGNQYLRHAQSPGTAPPKLFSYTAPQQEEKSRKYTRTHLGSTWGTKTQVQTMLRAATPFWRWRVSSSCLASQPAHRTSLGPRCPTTKEEEPFSVGNNQLHLVLLSLKSSPEQFLWHIFFPPKTCMNTSTLNSSQSQKTSEMKY